MTGDLARSLRAEMARAADPEKAVGMRKYMKSTMPFYGLHSAAVSFKGETDR